MKRKLLCLFMAVMLLTASLAVPASAATTNGFSNLSSSNYAKTFCLGNGTVIPYTSSTLKTRGTTTGAQSGAWIDGRSDEIYLFSVGINSSGIPYAYVSYPGTSKRVCAYIKLSDVVYGASVSHTKSTSSGKMYMATKSSGALNSSYWIDKGDPVWRLSSTAVDGKYQVMAPRGAGGYRIGWVTTADYNKYAGASTSASTSSASSSLCWPCKSTYISTMYYYWNGGSPSSHKTLSNRWNAFDVAGSSGESIYAVAAGKIVSAGWRSGGFGYCVVIEHSNGLQSLYGHLKSAPPVSKGQTVTKGQLIGYMGNSGTSYGVHLHFEMYNPSSLSIVINPWSTYYQGKVNVTIGGNSAKANATYKSDSYAQNWVNWLTSSCKKNSSGDYVFAR